MIVVTLEVLDTAMAEALGPGWRGRLLTHRVAGLDRYDEMMRLPDRGLPPMARRVSEIRLVGEADATSSSRQAPAINGQLGGPMFNMAVVNLAEIVQTVVHGLLRDKAAALDRKLHDLLAVRRRIAQSLAAWERRPASRALICAHIGTPARRPRDRTMAGRDAPGQDRRPLNGSPGERASWRRSVTSGGSELRGPTTQPRRVSDSGELSSAVTARAA